MLVYQIILLSKFVKVGYWNNSWEITWFGAGLNIKDWTKHQPQVIKSRATSRNHFWPPPTSYSNDHTRWCPGGGAAERGDNTWCKRGFLLFMGTSKREGEECSWQRKAFGRSAWKWAFGLNWKSRVSRARKQM